MATILARTACSRVGLTRTVVAKSEAIGPSKRARTGMRTALTRSALSSRGNTVAFESRRAPCSLGDRGRRFLHDHRELEVTELRGRKRWLLRQDFSFSRAGDGVDRVASEAERQAAGVGVDYAQLHFAQLPGRED